MTAGAEEDPDGEGASGVDASTSGDPSPRRPPGLRTWTVTDTGLLSLLAFGGGLLRVWRLSVPPGIIFDEFYAVDACRYLYGSAHRCDVSSIPFESEISTAHPPLGKWLIAAGVRLVGFRPAGWRVASVLAGTMTIALLYVLARLLTGRTWAAGLAAGLLGVDFLHLVFSRTAMLDVFVTLFVTAAVLFAVLDADQTSRDPPTSRRGSVLRQRWRLAAGAAVGAGGACKWSGWFVLPAVLLIIVLPVVRSKRNGNGAAHRLRAELPYLGLTLVVVPLAVYAATFAGRVHGPLLQLPWVEGSWASEFFERQSVILHSHLGVRGGHPSTSPGWSWPLLKRPVSLYFSEGTDGRYREILAIGNPIAWWPGLVAIIWSGIEVVRTRLRCAAALAVVAPFLAVYGPWLVAGRGHGQDFLYYFLPGIPFLCLAIAHVARDIARTRTGRSGIAIFAVATLTSFAFFHPLLTARPLDYAAWEARIVFRDCAEYRATRSGSEAPPAARLRPTSRPGPPPRGWCWV